MPRASTESTSRLRDRRATTSRGCAPSWTKWLRGAFRRSAEDPQARSNPEHADRLPVDGSVGAQHADDMILGAPAPRRAESNGSRGAPARIPHGVLDGTPQFLARL